MTKSDERRSLAETLIDLVEGSPRRAEWSASENQRLVEAAAAGLNAVGGAFNRAISGMETGSDPLLTLNALRHLGASEETVSELERETRKKVASLEHAASSDRDISEEEIAAAFTPEQLAAFEELEKSFGAHREDVANRASEEAKEPR